MKNKSTQLQPLSFARPHVGFCFGGPAETELELSKLPAWRSNGGPTRGHPARSLPFTLEAKFDLTMVVRIHVVGIFAQYAGPDHEVPGTLGASLQLLEGDQILYHHELTNGVHYSDGACLEPQMRTMGDGSTIVTVGTVEVDGCEYRVDELTLDVPPDLDVDSFKFKTLASPASFVIFDAYVEAAAPHGCPFHTAGRGVPLARIGSIVRLGDRVEFAKALTQLEEGILSSEELDEARGQALTFLAVLTAALLEIGGSRKLILEQLYSAREVEGASHREAVWEVVLGRVETLAPNLMVENVGYSDRLVDKALSYIERNYARPLTDASVAGQLGLSTSHFRFLFRQATGQPFHKYVIAARLEKAHRMLLELDSASVGSVAKAVGFLGLSHFSRAFTQRFNVSPASVRKNSAGHAGN